MPVARMRDASSGASAARRSLVRSSPGRSRQVRGLAKKATVLTERCVVMYMLDMERNMRYMSRHVRRGGAEPLVAARHPAARELPRRGQGQESHPRESQRLVQRADRGLAAGPPGPGAGPGRPPRGRGAGDCAQLAAWPCGGGAGERAPVGPRAAAGPQADAGARPGGGDDRAAAARPRLEAGHGPGLGRGDPHQHPQPHVEAAGGGRRRSLRGPGLAAAAAGGHRTGAGPAPFAGRAAGALRRDLDVLRGAALPAGQAGAFARRQAGQAADRVRRAHEWGRAVRWRSRCSTATPGIRRRSRRP